MQTLAFQIVTLFVLAIPIACVAWTCTHEEIFREPREFCQDRCKTSKSVLRRKFFYVFTCEYCFSHWVTLGFLAITRFKLLYPDWRGYLIALFSLVWVANQYISIYNHLRLDIKHEKIEIEAENTNLKKMDAKKAA